MAKDPAFLFYPGDWQGGTTTFSRHLKGAYIDLLIAQFNNGPLSLEEIKTVLGSDFGQVWPTLQKKFKFENGLYFNERILKEMNKRSSYTFSRRKNAKHMLEHMENGNRNENEIINKSNYEIYGELRKVLLTTEEYGKLVEKLGENNTNVLISDLDTYIASKGKNKYASHYATLLSWARRKIESHAEKKALKTKQFIV